MAFVITEFYCVELVFHVKEIGGKVEDWCPDSLKRVRKFSSVRVETSGLGSRSS